MIAVEVAAAACAERTRDFPGDLRQVGAARLFVARELDGSPARDRLLICVSELAANAVEHTASGAGGTFTVTVGQPEDGVAFVSVTDEGGSGQPVIRAAGGLAEGGRGLALVDACSDRWGYRDEGRGHTVWAEVRWPAAAARDGGCPRARGEDMAR